MGKTRRKLYGKTRRRRQRGKGVGTLCKGAILAGLLALNGAHAQAPGFRQLVSNYVNGGWKESQALGEFLADPKNYVPESFPSGLFTSSGSGVEATSCAMPSGIDEAKVLEPYLLKNEGKYQVKFTGEIPEGAKDVGPNSIVIFKGSYINDDDPDDPVVTYTVQRASDVGDPTYRDRFYDIPANVIELTPVKDGGRKRRKTLRRK